MSISGPVGCHLSKSRPSGSGVQEALVSRFSPKHFTHSQCRDFVDRDKDFLINEAEFATAMQLIKAYRMKQLRRSQPQQATKPLSPRGKSSAAPAQPAPGKSPLFVVFSFEEDSRTRGGTVFQRCANFVRSIYARTS